MLEQHPARTLLLEAQEKGTVGETGFELRQAERGMKDINRIAVIARQLRIVLC